MAIAYLIMKGNFLILATANKTRQFNGLEAGSLTNLFDFYNIKNLTLPIQNAISWPPARTLLREQLGA